MKRYSGPSGGGSVNQGGIWRYYTDDAAGLKMSDHHYLIPLIIMLSVADDVVSLQWPDDSPRVFSVLYCFCRFPAYFWQVPSVKHVSVRTAVI